MEFEGIAKNSLVCKEKTNGGLNVQTFTLKLEPQIEVDSNFRIGEQG
jgi:hypothetical protein